MATATPGPKARDLKPNSRPEMPPLQTGDHLSATEFVRRYEAMPEIKKAELIEGVVHVASPVRIIQHGMPQGIILGWLTHYIASTPGLIFGDNSTVHFDERNVFQPDAVLFIDPEHGGRVRIVDGYAKGSPELAVEITASTVDLDLRDKLDVYRRHGVREYIVWRTLDGAIDWFTLRDGEYVLTPPAADGLIRSEAFPGLWLDPAALIARNLARVLAVVGEGTRSPEHAAFVAKLDAPH